MRGFNADMGQKDFFEIGSTVIAGKPSAIKVNHPTPEGPALI
jgi:hypothetical protein